MSKNIALVILLCCSVEAAISQDKSSADYERFIDQTDLTALVTTMASTEMEGRKTGEKGQKLTAALIANRFKELGIKATASSPDFFQKFSLIRSSPDITSISINGQKLQQGMDYLFEGELDMPEAQKLPLIYVGLGDDSTLDQLELKDKAVAFISQRDKNFDLERKLKKRGVKMVIKLLRQPISTFQESSTFRERGPYIRTRQQKVFAHGSFLIDFDRFRKMYGQLPTFKQGEQVAEKQTGTFSYLVKRKNETIHTENVLGIVEGSSLKNEVIVLSAHYDHEGIKDNEIFAGADDNASGTAALLALAKAFKKAQDLGDGPKRTLLFIAFSAEEDGLLGSYHYVNHPAFPVHQHLVNFNMDMLGRVSPEYADYEYYMYVLGTNRHPSIKTLLDSVNHASTRLELDYSLDIPEKIYRQSDQWAFAQKGIPAIGYFNGVHDDYHTPGDTADRINFRMLRKRALLIFHSTWLLANYDGVLKLDP